MIRFLKYNGGYMLLFCAVILIALVAFSAINTVTAWLSCQGDAWLGVR